MVVFRRAVVFLEETIPAYLLLALVLAISYGVMMRYVFNNPVLWINQLAAFLFVWQLFLGAAGAARKHMHIGIDVFVSLLPGKARAAQELFASSCILVMLAGFIFLGWGLAFETSKMLQTLGFDYTYVYIAVPVGFALIALHVGEDIVRAARGLWFGGYVPPSTAVDALMDTSGPQVSL